MGRSTEYAAHRSRTLIVNREGVLLIIIFDYDNYFTITTLRVSNLTRDRSSSRLARQPVNTASVDAFMFALRELGADPLLRDKKPTRIRECRSPASPLPRGLARNV
ncbi:hypothetical protein EVAR_31683_1 [Eumeta japonica]|uniref:Uncharacterized protein n=1 Tax=Eumeta variegata TaxID=151549 RepID=A0A4C1VTU3_EUMVA|nr:hypothetical protein EVAR_31683_1 [Eumeta japonica]